MRDHVLLYINGQRLEVRGDEALLPLSDYLRYTSRLTGTKIVCSEGDCGACAVLVGRPGDPDSKRLNYLAITSCIALVAQLDGAHIITVEGLAQTKAAKEILHPVQKEMIANAGAQCGYCTPGIVVSLAGMCENKKNCSGSSVGAVGGSCHLNDAEARLGLTGNLCRCTGYEQILKAATAVDCAQVTSLNDSYPPTFIDALTQAAATPFLLQTPSNKQFYKPTTIPDACKFKSENPACTVIAGGTDIGVMVNKSRIDPTAYLSLSALSDPTFNQIEETPTHLIAGGNATLTALESATKTAIPQLYAIMIRHGSPLIRNSGTLAGNIVNASPIGDTMPALMVLSAELELTGFQDNKPTTRRINMNAFYTAYRKTVLRPDELLTRIFIPKPSPSETLRLYKISKRWDLDISTFTAAFWIKTAVAPKSSSNGHHSNGHPHLIIEDIRIAYGGVGPVILRLPKTESFLKGKELTEDIMQQAGELARSEITPISDVRSSADYRWQLAENMPLKCFYDLTGQTIHELATN